MLLTCRIQLAGGQRKQTETLCLSGENTHFEAASGLVERSAVEAGCAEITARGNEQYLVLSAGTHPKRPPPFRFHTTISQSTKRAQRLRRSLR